MTNNNHPNRSKRVLVSLSDDQINILDKAMRTLADDITTGGAEIEDEVPGFAALHERLRRARVDVRAKNR